MMYGAGGAGDDMHGHESGMGHIGAPGGHQAGSASSFQHQQMRPSSSYSASQSAASMPASSSSSSFRPFSGYVRNISVLHYYFSMYTLTILS